MSDVRANKLRLGFLRVAQFINRHTTCLHRVKDRLRLGRIAEGLLVRKLTHQEIQAIRSSLCADFVSRKSGILPDPVKPADTLADVPFVRAFVARSPSAGAESIQRFYEEYESMNKFLTSFKLQIKDLNSEEAQKLSGYAGYAAIMSYKNNLSELSQTIRLIEKDPVSSAGEKRQLIDHVYLGMISIAKEGLQAIYAIKDEINQKPESGGSND